MNRNDNVLVNGHSSCECSFSVKRVISFFEWGEVFLDAPRGLAEDAAEEELRSKELVASLITEFFGDLQQLPNSGFVSGA